MQIKNKTMAIVITAILVISMAVSIGNISTVKATGPNPVPGHPNDSYDAPTQAAISAGMYWVGMDANATATRLTLWNRYQDNITTHVYIITAPNPIGVGQADNIVMFNPQVPQNGLGSIAAGYPARYMYTFTVTTPNNVTTTYPTATPPSYSSWSMNSVQNVNGQNVFVSDSTGSTYMSYTPDTVGNYTFTVNFIGFRYLFNATNSVVQNNDYYGAYYKSSSYTTELTVQQDPVSLTGLTEPSYSAIPTEYWSRPIEQENTQWYAIASNWLENGHDLNNGGSQNAYQPDGTAPNSGHILWTTPEEDSGILGGSNTGRAGNSFNTGSQYQPRLTQPTYGGEGPIIMYGRLYYSPSIYYTGYSELFNCIDLKTGQFLYQVNTTAVTGSRNLPQFGYYYSQDDVNEHGIQNPGWLFSSNYAVGYQPEYGYPELHFANVPSGTEIQGPAGEGLRFILPNLGTTASPIYTNLLQWNSSRIIPTISSGAAPNTNTYQGNVPLSPAPTVITTNPYTWNGSAFVSIPAASIPKTIGTSNVNYAVTWVNNAWINYTTSSPLNQVYQNGVWMANPVTTSPLTFAGLNAGSVPSYDYNVTLTYQGQPFHFATTPTIAAASVNDIVWGFNASWPTGTSAPSYTYPDNVSVWAIDINPAHTTFGSLLYLTSITTDIAPTTDNQNLLFEHADAQEGVFVAIEIPSQTFWVWNMHTGNLMFTTDVQADTLSPFGYYAWPSLISGTQIKTAYGMMYTGGYTGTVSAYSLNSTGTGVNPVWRYNVIPTGTAGTIKSSPGMMTLLADGKLYVGTHEHSAETPLEAGNNIKCLNATTTDPAGQLLWEMSGWVYPSAAAVADGVLTYFNNYDGQIYGVGQGPSALTVSAPQASIELGRSLVISGTVMDVSAGTQQTTVKADFPNGVPAVSDASESAMMEYVYMQKSAPSNATGVPVSIDAVDSNGNFRHIGDTTSDASGAFSYQYTPDITGKYTVYASFAGSNSYYGSSSETSFAVDAAAPTQAPTSTPVQSTADLYFVPAIAGLFVAIIIVGLLIVMVLRKLLLKKVF